MIEWILLIITSLVATGYIYLVWNFNYWKKRDIPGPKPKLLVGNVPGMLTYSQHVIFDIDGIYRQYKGRERFVGIFVGRKPHLLIIDPKLIREVLVTNFKNFQANDILFPVDKEIDKLLAQNPFVLTGTEWKEKRGEITPALTTNRIKASFPIMQIVCQRMSKYLEMLFENPPKDGIEAKDFASRYTIEVVTNCIFGLEAGGFSGNESVIRDEASKIFSSNTALAMFFILLTKTFPIIRKIVRVPVVSKNSEQFFTNLTNDAIKHREEMKDDRVDFLNYLLQLRDKKNLSSLDMASHTLTFFIDGFETSSVLISHCIHMLAKHKDVQDKLRKEIHKTISTDNQIAFEKLLDLPYLDCVINETLRLYPPVGFLSKACTNPQELTKSSGSICCVEKDDVVIIPIYSIHRDKEYYHDPDEFIPERFTEENGGVKKYKDMEVFLPFGDGPRQCLGLRFALAQSKAAIAELVTNWEMSVNSKTRKEFRADPKYILFVMDGGIWIDFKKIPGGKENISI